MNDTERTLVRAFLNAADAFLIATAAATTSARGGVLDDYFDARKRVIEMRGNLLVHTSLAPIPNEPAAPDPVEAEHGIDPDNSRDGGFKMGGAHVKPPPAWYLDPGPPVVRADRSQTFTFPDRTNLVGATVYGSGPGAPVHVHTFARDEAPAPDLDLVEIDRKHVIALIGSALTLANDLTKRGHPRNAARYTRAALALATAGGYREDTAGLPLDPDPSAQEV